MHLVDCAVFSILCLTIAAVCARIPPYAGDWRSGSAGPLQGQGRGFKSLIAHHVCMKSFEQCLLGGLFVSAFLLGNLRTSCLASAAESWTAAGAYPHLCAGASRFSSKRLCTCFFFIRVLSGAVTLRLFPLVMSPACVSSVTNCVTFQYFEYSLKREIS